MWKLVMYRTHYPVPDPAGSWYEKKVRFRPDPNLKKKSGRTRNCESGTSLMPWDMFKLNQRVDHTNLIIRQQAFGRLRPFSSWLGLVSQSQPKNLQSSIYKRFIHASSLWKFFTLFLNPFNDLILLSKQYYL